MRSLACILLSSVLSMPVHAAPQNPKTLGVTNQFFGCLAAPHTPLTKDDVDRQRKNIGEALRLPRAIIVDKKAHRLTLYERGRPVQSYRVNLGHDPINQKLVEGDCRTPEGKFSVRYRLDESDTDHYRSLALDYPTFSDYARLIHHKLTLHDVPLNAKPGSKIAIHGMGDRAYNAVDATDGCVELRNEDMRRLYDRTPFGTPVVIVREWPR